MSEDRKIAFSLPLHSLNIPDDEVHFREPTHVPAAMDSHIPMTYEQWVFLGKPEKIQVTVEHTND